MEVLQLKILQVKLLWCCLLFRPKVVASFSPKPAFLGSQPKRAGTVAALCFYFSQPKSFFSQPKSFFSQPKSFSFAWRQDLGCFIPHVPLTEIGFTASPESSMRETSQPPTVKWCAAYLRRRSFGSLLGGFSNVLIRSHKKEDKNNKQTTILPNN